MGPTETQTGAPNYVPAVTASGSIIQYPKYYNETVVRVATPRGYSAKAEGRSGFRAGFRVSRDFAAVVAPTRACFEGTAGTKP